MNREPKIRVNLLYDFPHWILAEYALQVQATLNEQSQMVCASTGPYPQSAWELWTLSKDVDVIHFLAPQPFYRFCRIIPKPVVATVNHIADDSEWEAFRNFHSYASAICTTNNQWKQRIESNMHATSPALFLHPLGLDCKLFTPTPSVRSALRESFGCDDSTILLGFSAKRSSDVGSRKGLDRLWKLMDMLVSRYADRIKLLLFGPDAPRVPAGWSPGDQPASLSDHVIIPGFLDRQDLPKYYGALDFYLCLSRAEGGPYPVMECMACEVPVISTPVGIVPDLIEDGVNSFLVNANDYLERIPQILERGSHEGEWIERIRNRARISVVNRHSWDKVISFRTFEEIYSHAQACWRRKAAPEKWHTWLRLRARMARESVGTTVRRAVRSLGSSQQVRSRPVGSPPRPEK